MTSGIIDKADHDLSLNWGEQTEKLRHHLDESGLFTDDNLAELIERIPQSVSPINTMAAKGHELESWSYCDRSGLSGHQVLEAIKRGRLWINMQKVEETDPRFDALLSDMYSELNREIPGFSPFRKSLGLLISSPGAQVFYHADVPGQSLWQIRGEKRIYIYPPTEPFLTAPDLENIIRGITEEEIHYDPAFDADAEVYDIKPGDMLHWKLNGPHRVENADCLNVSVTTEHWTPPIRRHFAMNYGNGVLRRELGWTPSSRRISGPAFWAKTALAVAWRTMGLQQKTAFKRVMRYRVDPGATDGISPLGTAPAE
jgi:hypothetical protein